MPHKPRLAVAELDTGVKVRWVCEARLYCGPMQPTPKRSELDGLAEFYALDVQRTERMLELAGARPSRAEGLRFLATGLRIAGVLSLAAGLVFFVAANWSELTIFGRFALVQLVLVACVAVAWLKPPPASIGRGAVFLAFIAAGALFALFGQTYQTGADIYELFLTWALLGLPLVIAAQWSVASAAWVLVLNTALLLFCHHDVNAHAGNCRDHRLCLATA
jgi:hypothetical protein